MKISCVCPVPLSPLIPLDKSLSVNLFASSSSSSSAVERRDGIKMNMEKSEENMKLKLKKKEICTLVFVR